MCKWTLAVWMALSTHAAHLQVIYGVSHLSLFVVQTGVGDHGATEFLLHVSKFVLKVFGIFKAKDLLLL